MAKGNIVVLKDNKLEVREVETVKVNGISVIHYGEMKTVIGGWLEHITYNRNLDSNNIDMWCDEEGKLKGLKEEIAVYERESNEVIEWLVGTIVFTGRAKNNDSISLTDAQIELIKKELMPMTMIIKEPLPKEKKLETTVVKFMALAWK